MRNQITDALASACMPLRKWKSNDSNLIQESVGDSCLEFHQEGNAVTKTLGLSWQTSSDDLCIPRSVPETLKPTMRGMLVVI